MKVIKSVGALIATVVTAGILIWWLVIVADRIGVKPEVVDGKVVLDEWARAKDILLVVLPLFSAALAFWVGNQGTADAKKDAEGAKKQLDAVIDASPEGVLKKAMADHPESFSN
ncbi:MAG: hypothetical protein WD598_15200 [Acidimicrobiia bacterium]